MDKGRDEKDKVFSEGVEMGSAYDGAIDRL